VNVSAKIFFGILIALSYLVTPAALCWGWSRWTHHQKCKTVTAMLSLIGFAFATASAVLAVSSIAYAQIHHFPYYDPLLLRIFRLGGLLALAGILFGISGVWRSSPLRWHSPLCGLGMLAFWFLTASGE
jgi:hypothetical protein